MNNLNYETLDWTPNTWKTKSKVLRHIWEQDKEQVDWQVNRQTHWQIWEQVRDQVRGQVWEHVINN